LSEFLSPFTNRRDDIWGGNIDNRSRILIDIIEGVRATVGTDFPISVKINSSDFQRGGLTEEESLAVIHKLEAAGIDLLEISGGTYEQSAFLLLNERKSTRRREAYFIDFARKVRDICNIPLMVTGGFRSYAFCQEVLGNNEVDFIGMARPFLSSLDDMQDFLAGNLERLNDPVVRTGIPIFENAAEGGFHARQLIRLAKGKAYEPRLSALMSASFLVTHELYKSMKRKSLQA
jgi:2,4-dienoyl-CoA reductase-like NADH-dependent reductase (Old Yellow Enzyme family)